MLMAARSKAWVPGSSIAGIAGSNPSRGHGCLCVVSCQVQVSVTGWSLVQGTPTDCGVSEYDHLQQLTLYSYSEHVEEIRLWKEEEKCVVWWLSDWVTHWLFLHFLHQMSVISENSVLQRSQDMHVLRSALQWRILQIRCINPLKTKRGLLSLKNQFLPRSKHFLSRL